MAMHRTSRSIENAWPLQGAGMKFCLKSLVLLLWAPLCFLPCTAQQASVYYNSGLCQTSSIRCDKENSWNSNFCYFDGGSGSLKNYFPPYRFPYDLGDGSIGSTSWDVQGWTYMLSDAAFKGFGTGQYVARACASHPTTMDSYFLYTPNQVFSSQTSAGVEYDLVATPVFSSSAPYNYAGPCNLAGSYPGIWISLQLPYPVVVNRVSFTSISSSAYPAGYRVYCKQGSAWALLFDSASRTVSYTLCTRAQCGDSDYDMLVHDSGCFNNTLFACHDVAVAVGRRGGPLAAKWFNLANLRFYNYTDEATLASVLPPPTPAATPSPTPLNSPSKSPTPVPTPVAATPSAQPTPSPTPVPTPVPAEPYSYSGPVLCDQGVFACSLVPGSSSSYWCAFRLRQYPPYEIPASNNPMSLTGSNGRERWETVGWNYTLDGRAGHGPAGLYTVRACSDYVKYDNWDRLVFLSLSLSLSLFLSLSFSMSLSLSLSLAPAFVFGNALLC